MWTGSNRFGQIDRKNSFAANNTINMNENEMFNKLSKHGNLNFTVNSKVYNHIENVHQYWLLMLCDLAALKK